MKILRKLRRKIISTDDKLMLKRKLIFLAIMVFFALIGFSLFSNATTVNADSESDQPLDCLSCHQQTLEYHDRLGSGNNACWTCHDDTDMTQLRFADGTQLSQDDSNELCGQCHQERFKAWQDGTHGFPGTVALGKCAACHNPHKPQISLQTITRPHPESAPSALDPPFDLIMIAVISLAFMTGLGIIVAKRGTE